MADDSEIAREYTWRMYESTVQTFMTLPTSTAPKCPQCGSSPVREVSMAELSSMKCDQCGTAIPPQSAAEARFNFPHLLGEDNRAAWVEAERRAGLRKR